MHFKNARNASVYAVFRAFFTQSLAKLRCCSRKGSSKEIYFLEGNTFFSNVDFPVWRGPVNRIALYVFSYLRNLFSNALGI